MSEAATGCCSGQASIEADGFRLPNSSRAAAATALTGFQSAIVRRISGMRCVGTSVLETNALRMACSIGAVFAALMGASAMYGDADPDEVAGYVRAAVHDLFPASG